MGVELKHDNESGFDYFICPACGEEVWPDREVNECPGCGLHYDYEGNPLNAELTDDDGKPLGTSD
jgi:hypothetical protein